jgi:hypothetical protein
LGQLAGGGECAGDDLARRVITAEGVYRYPHVFWLAGVGLLGGFYGHDGSSLVTTALGTYPVGHPLRPAVGAHHQIGTAEGVVRPALVPAG